MRGGARVRAGRPMDPQALRRDRVPMDVELLPVAGREGEPPTWPLTRPRARELQLWAEVWALPQAIVWERQRQELEVALYVRSLADAERPGARSATRVLVRQFMDSLGISAGGMRAARLAIVDVIPTSEPTPRPATDSQSSKDRLRVLRATDDNQEV